MFWLNVGVCIIAFHLLNVHCKDGKETKEDCADKLSYVRCKSLYKTGACTSKAEAMRHLCPEACGFCGKSCRDVFAAKCPFWVKHGACETHKIMKDWCRKGCGYCKAEAPSIKGCQGSWYGCCWDGTRSALGPNMKGCGECKDYMALCKVFKVDCHSVRNRGFMRYNCPQTCGLCKKKYRQ